MTILRTWMAGGLAMVVVLGGCSTLRGRDRIVAAPNPCTDQTVQIYFEPDSAEVTREGQAVISQAAHQARGCAVERVQVLGLADAAGAPQPNLELSARRAQAVSAALAAAGLPSADFELAAAGQEGAVADSGAVAPVRRRADIVLSLAPR